MRSFIAIELPDTAKSALAELQRELKKTGADIRWVKPDNLHLTLKFLGNIEEKVIGTLVQVMRGTCNKYTPFNLEIKGMGFFPNVRSPRIIWVGINGNTAMTGIQSEIDSGLSSLGFEREKRNYAPHLTLGRFRTSQGKRLITEAVEQFSNRSFGVIGVESLSLMRSDLHQAGARYTKIAEISLRETGPESAR